LGNHGSFKSIRSQLHFSITHRKNDGVTLMKTLSIDQFIEGLKTGTLGRPALKQQASLSKAVEAILHQVRTDGDSALLKYRERFDGSSGSEIYYVTDVQDSDLEPELKVALDTAYSNITHFHRAQLPTNISIETQTGIRCSQLWRPIEIVGLYIPGGSAPLISTLLMLGIPAQLANCGEIVVCSPAVPTNELKYAAKLCGINRIYAFGGAQAIAAMAYGTETLPKVDKVFGPGNAFVTEAKRQVSLDPQGAAIDMPAGPSEVMVIADEQAHPEVVAADLLSQAEHGNDSQVVLISLAPKQLPKIKQALTQQLQVLNRRDVAKQAISNSFCIIADNKQEVIQAINLYAPEHLILNIKQPETWVDDVQHAGSLFLGPWTPESFGDYASGTNHVLPTYGYAKQYSGLKTTDFMKSLTVQAATITGFKALAPSVVQLAEAEQLDAHANAVRVRLNQLYAECTGRSPFMVDQAVPSKHLPYIRDHLQGFMGYQSAQRSKHNTSIWLSANELTKPLVSNLTYAQTAPVNRYPTAQPEQIKRLYTDYAGVNPEQCLITRGADEGIELLIRTCCEPLQDHIMTLDPTYGMYAISAQLHNIKCTALPLNDKDKSENNSLIVNEALFKQRLPFSRLFFLCNPNNPTGQAFSLTEIEQLLRRLGPNRVLVVDEAYIEFAEVSSAVTLLSQYSNLVILRTLSKAFGLAGIRCGFILSNPDFIQVLSKVIAPYPINNMVEPIVEAAFTKEAIQARRQAIADVKYIRQQLYTELNYMDGIKVPLSQGNFLYLQGQKTSFIWERCQAQGIAIRPFNTADRLNLRVSIGSYTEMQTFCNALSLPINLKSMNNLPTVTDSHYLNLSCRNQEVTP
jgi:histidinol-phosphate aminotransferase